MTKAYVEDITQEKFNKCIEDLVSEGQAISVRNIVNSIGGSNETISRMLRQYQRNQAIASFEKGMPLAFREAVEQAALQLYQYFDKLMTEDRIKLQNQYDEMNKDLTALIKKADATAESYKEKFLKEQVERQKAQAAVELRETDLRKQIEKNNALAEQIAKYSMEQQQSIIDAINALKTSPQQA